MKEIQFLINDVREQTDNVDINGVKDREFIRYFNDAIKSIQAMIFKTILFVLTTKLPPFLRRKFLTQEFLTFLLMCSETMQFLLWKPALTEGLVGLLLIVRGQKKEIQFLVGSPGTNKFTLLDDQI